MSYLKARFDSVVEKMIGTESPVDFESLRAEPTPEYQVALEIHKNCDSMLHQRLASFTAAQSFSLAAFMLLTVARFQAALAPDRIVFLDAIRYAIIAFGIVLSVFGWMVTYPMLMRLRYLDDIYLRNNRVYAEDIDIEHVANTHDVFSQVPGIKKLWRVYRWVIPILLPFAEFALWIFIFIVMTLAKVFTAEPTRNCPALEVGQIWTGWGASLVGGLPV